MKRAIYPQPYPSSTIVDAVEASFDVDELERLRKIIEALKLGIVNVATCRDRKIEKLQVRLDLQKFAGSPSVSRFMNSIVERTDNKQKLEIFKRLVEENINLRK